MRKTLTISLAAIILLASMSNALVFLNFKLHQSEIARTLCINKEKPKLHCEGKCVLNQRLAAQNDKEQPSPAPFSNLEDNSRLTFFFQWQEDTSNAAISALYKHLFIYQGICSQTIHSPPLLPPEPFFS
jgi:hypothetical protein